MINLIVSNYIKHFYSNQSLYLANIVFIPTDNEMNEMITCDRNASAT